MPLRIVQITNEPYGFDTANGVQHVAYRLVEAQADRGDVIALFTRDDHGLHVFGPGVEPPEHNGAEITFGRSIRERLLAAYFEPELAADVLAWRPDIVHFHSVHVPQNVALAAYLQRCRIPYCVTVHGGLFATALERRRLAKAAFKRLFELRYLNGALFVHALSPDEADVIRSHGVTAPIVMAPNGLPPGIDLPPTRSDALFTQYPWIRGRQVFMFIGRLEPWQKGLDLLFQAFADAALQRTVVVLVGPDDGGSLTTLRALAERLGILPDVVFAGPAFGQDRANFLAAADVFVHPSRWEGVSLSVLAAAAAGKACLITREADPLGSLGRAHAAFIVDGTVRGIAAGLRAVSDASREQLEEIGARARRVVEGEFSWSLAARALAEAYRSAPGTLRQQ
jgi:glycosyltransferase involved in cell wall biosynthesis